MTVMWKKCVCRGESLPACTLPCDARGRASLLTFLAHSPNKEMWFWAQLSLLCGRAKGLERGSWNTDWVILWVTPISRHSSSSKSMSLPPRELGVHSRRGTLLSHQAFKGSLLSAPQRTQLWLEESSWLLRTWPFEHSRNITNGIASQCFVTFQVLLSLLLPPAPGFFLVGRSTRVGQGQC